MFQELLSFWNDDSSLKHIFKHFDEMLNISSEMFVDASGCLFDSCNLESTKSKLIRMDGQLNILQQVIRRDVITHITVQGTGDIVPCLAMMSLVKDAERLGDYVKNFFEIVDRCPSIKTDKLLPELKNLSEKIATWFTQTKKAFDDVDENLARKVREEIFKYEKSCDKVVWDLMCQEKTDRNVTPIALAFRFYKRIIAHLANICTSVVMPLDKIDYYKPLST